MGVEGVVAGGREGGGRGRKRIGQWRVEMVEVEGEVRKRGQGVGEKRRWRSRGRKLWEWKVWKAWSGGGGR
jgi:hypothetical protein